ncbi:MAG: hypothetical protein WBM28_17840 [Burkholderiales bacterium]
MNRFQEVIFVATLVNLAVMLLFPPYETVVMGLGVTTFDAFYFILARHHNKFIYWNLLLIEMYWVLINAAIAWILLRRRRPSRRLMSRRNATLVFVSANLVLILLFPPFENYASVLKLAGTYFDSFYFAFGDKGRRQFYVPLLYLEVWWLLLNGAVLWLRFRERPPKERSSGR